MVETVQHNPMDAQMHTDMQGPITTEALRSELGGQIPESLRDKFEEVTGKIDSARAELAGTLGSAAADSVQRFEAGRSGRIDDVIGRYSPDFTNNSYGTRDEKKVDKRKLEDEVETALMEGLGIPADLHLYTDARMGLILDPTQRQRLQRLRRAEQVVKQTVPGIVSTATADKVAAAKAEASTMGEEAKTEGGSEAADAAQGFVDERLGSFDNGVSYNVDKLRADTDVYTELRGRQVGGGVLGLGTRAQRKAAEAQGLRVPSKKDQKRAVESAEWPVQADLINLADFLERANSGNTITGLSNDFLNLSAREARVLGERLGAITSKHAELLRNLPKDPKAIQEIIDKTIKPELQKLGINLGVSAGQGPDTRRSGDAVEAKVFSDIERMRAEGQSDKDIRRHYTKIGHPESPGFIPDAAIEFQHATQILSRKQETINNPWDKQ